MDCIWDTGKRHVIQHVSKCAQKTIPPNLITRTTLRIDTEIIRFSHHARAKPATGGVRTIASQGDAASAVDVTGGGGTTRRKRIRYSAKHQFDKSVRAICTNAISRQSTVNCRLLLATPPSSPGHSRVAPFATRDVL